MAYELSVLGLRQDILMDLRDHFSVWNTLDCLLIKFRGSRVSLVRNI
jgi:hypothetical protein